MDDLVPLRDVPGLSRVAQVFSPVEVALSVSVLESAGFKVFAPGFHTLSNLQSYAVAFGGVPILVETDHAEEAVTFLEAHNRGMVTLIDEPQTQTIPEKSNALPPITILRRVLGGVICIFLSVAPPLPGRFINQ